MDQQLPLTTGKQMVSPFTSEDDQAIIELFKEGHSMGAIGNQLKRSRSAIAGRIHRLRTVLKDKLGEDDLKPRRGEPPKGRVKIVETPSKPRLSLHQQELTTLDDDASPFTPKPRVRLRMIDENTTEVTHNELEWHHCRWPKGDPRHSDFRFCGAPRISGSARTPYCQKHALMAGQQYSNVRINNPIACN